MSDDDEETAYDAIRAMRAKPIELSGARATTYVEAKYAGHVEPQSPLPLDESEDV